MKRLLFCILAAAATAFPVHAQRIGTCSSQAVEVAPNLLFSWVNYDRGFKGAAYYREQCAGRVYLSGAISGGHGVAFQLPQGYRPAATEAFAVYALGRPVAVIVDAAGTVSVFDATTRDLVEFVSLAGISFLAAP